MKMVLVRWAAVWTTNNSLDGYRRSFRVFDWKDRKYPRLFATKRECSEWIRQEWGYIARRADLRREPHCWRVPKPVRVRVTIGEIK